MALAWSVRPDVKRALEICSVHIFIAWSQDASATQAEGDPIHEFIQERTGARVAFEPVRGIGANMHRLQGTEKARKLHQRKLFGPHP